MPVDVACFERFETMATRRRWLAYPDKHGKSFRVADVDWKALLQASTLQLKNSLEWNRAPLQYFKYWNQRELKGTFFEINTATRSGLKFSLIFLLIATYLMKFHEQLLVR